METSQSLFALELLADLPREESRVDRRDARVMVDLLESFTHGRDRHLTMAFIGLSFWE